MTNKGRTRERWFQDRTVIAAIIGGVFLLLSTAVGGYFATKKPEPLPPLEIKTITEGKERVLSTLALRPEAYVVDSAGFVELSDDYVVLSESLGVAIARPTAQEWTVGRITRAGSVSLIDIPYVAYIADKFAKEWQVDTTLWGARLGVRLDLPFKITLNRESVISGIPVGENLLDNADIAELIVNGQLRENDRDANWFERKQVRDELWREMDSITAAGLPVTKDVYSGVFIAPITQAVPPKYLGIGWHHLSLFDKVGLMLRPGVAVASLNYSDREERIALFNESVELGNVDVNGVKRDRVIINTLGYGIQVDTVVYLVGLQFLSDQDEATLQELKRFFRSVRLRGMRAKGPEQPLRQPSAVGPARP